MSALNSSKKELWNADIAASVGMYNSWFLEFGPRAYQDERAASVGKIRQLLEHTENLTKISSIVLQLNPSILQILRMTTAPPIARDRLIGLAGVSANLVRSMELKRCIPPRMKPKLVEDQLRQILDVLCRLADRDLIPWIIRNQAPTESELQRASQVIADRHTGALADPIIRNAQEHRQCDALRVWLETKGYQFKETRLVNFRKMEPGTFAFRLNVPAGVKIPVDVAIKPLSADLKDLPMLVEAKSAGDFTNPNKRRKEESDKVNRLRATYGEDVKFVLLLCGYFDANYLSYEAEKGIDWVWEHRLNDFGEAGL